MTLTVRYRETTACLCHYMMGVRQGRKGKFSEWVFGISQSRRESRFVLQSRTSSQVRINNEDVNSFHVVLLESRHWIYLVVYQVPKIYD